jgi:hypothetical protein
MISQRSLRSQARQLRARNSWIRHIPAQPRRWEFTGDQPGHKRRGNPIRLLTKQPRQRLFKHDTTLLGEPPRAALLTR